MSRTILLTNATQYAGPGAVDVLTRLGFLVVCHDQSFGRAAARDEFEQANPGVRCLESVEPGAIAAEIDRFGLELDAFVSNDVYPNTPKPVGEIALEDLRNTFEAVFMFPVHLTQLLLPSMKAKRAGSIVYVTSARPLRPEFGYAVPTSIRSATAAFAMALAREAAGYGIQVNVAAPNYLYSEAYYPRARFVDDPEGRAQIAGIVPMGRLGLPEEFGELIAFLVSGRSQFLTGQVIYFTGGWP